MTGALVMVIAVITTQLIPENEQSKITENDSSTKIGDVISIFGGTGECYPSL
ncbi:MAG: hypothetical protein PHX12_02825 [Proteiniphilum sp.]|jgi:hypothetical protein|nr:hypothetical protein [Proteiniphilum sp.]